MTSAFCPHNPDLNSITWYLWKRNKNTCVQKELSTSIYGSFIQNSKKLEMTPRSIDRYTKKPTLTIPSRAVRTSSDDSSINKDESTKQVRRERRPTRKSSQLLPHAREVPERETHRAGDSAGCLGVGAEGRGSP